MRTSAAIFVEHGQRLVIDDIELPDLGPSHVAVKLIASGICHSQLHQIHSPRQNVPVVLGHEATGVISGIGRGVSYVKEGDRVMVAWLPRSPKRGAPRPKQPSFTAAPSAAERGPNATSRCTCAGSRRAASCSTSWSAAATSSSRSTKHWPTSSAARSSVGESSSTDVHGEEAVHVTIAP